MNKAPFVLFSVSLLVVMTMISPATADILPPKKQMNFGISADDVVCETGMFKVIKESKGNVACVDAQSVSKLVSKGWAKPVDETKLKEFLTQIGISTGTINKIIITPINTDFGKQSPKVSVGSYDYVFEVCASTKTLFSPEVLIRSDSETKRYELAETVAPNFCILSATIIKASSPDSITATLVSKGDVSQILASLSEQVDSLSMQLQDAKKSFGRDNTEDNKKQGQKIAELRKQLNDAKADLYRIHFALYTPDKSKFTPERLSFLGAPITGETVTKVSATKSISTPDFYNVVFEACAGEKHVRLPVIQVASDRQNVDVKLGEKISPNTCLLSFAKVEATDPESISLKPAGNADSSNKAADLELKINSLNQELAAEKEAMKLLIHNPNKPSDFNEKLTSHVEKISSLREQTISAKAELSKILYLTYQ